MRTVRVLGASLVGAGAELVTVEARFVAADRERTEIVLTGLPDPVLRESRGRLECALAESGLGLASGRLFLNLVPASRKKSGEILDLPLALGAAAAGGHFSPGVLAGTLFLGELGIDGALHAVPGGLAAAMMARAAGLRRLIAPPATAREAAALVGMDVRGGQHLSQVLAHLTHPGGILPALEPELLDAGTDQHSKQGPRLDEVRGQAAGKHALAVAAAGGHALLFVGPPGVGKSLLARRLPCLLPEPDLEERLEITRVLSAAGRWPGGLARARPFRAPHHTVSYAGLVGGGPRIAPGEVTLAHRGVLFLDELAEFRRSVLEALRQPLESGSILISRAGRQIEFPARFQLEAAMNPCPCGYRGHPSVVCTCSPHSVQRYLQRISGPLFDRIDLRLELAVPALEELAGARDAARHSPGLAEDELRADVLAARSLQHERQAGTKNSELGSDQLDRFDLLDAAQRRFLEAAARRRGLSARALQSMRRVARTLADLERRERVTEEHLSQALALRAPLG